MAHILTDPSQLYSKRTGGLEQIIIHFSSQINGIPHLGTITTLGTAFALGRFLEQRLNMPAKVMFAALENSPGELHYHEGIEYTKLLSDTLSDTRELSIAEKYMISYRQLIANFIQASGIPCEMMSYLEFQKTPYVRQKLIEVIAREKEFGPLLSPSDHMLRFRFCCPDCGYQDKKAKTRKLVKKISSEELVFATNCFRHGTYESVISINTDTFIDLNTPLRSVLRKSLYIKRAKEQNALNILVDGGDWAHIVPILTSCLLMLGHGPAELPERLYAPLIEDWSGAKFSKSIYVDEREYESIPEGLINYQKFMKAYRNQGFLRLWNEISAWIRDPKKLYRNYSVEYMRRIIEDE